MVTKSLLQGWCLYQQNTPVLRKQTRKSSPGQRPMLPTQSGTWRSLTFRHRAGKNINHTFCSIGAGCCPFPLPHGHAFPQQALSKGCEATVRCAGDRTTARTSTAAPPRLVQGGQGAPHQPITVGTCTPSTTCALGFCPGRCQPQPAPHTAATSRLPRDPW